MTFIPQNRVNVKLILYSPFFMLFLVFYIASLATDSISLIRFSWFTYVAPGS